MTAIDVRPSTAIVILNWNNAPATARCIDAVMALEGPAVAMYVVDNGSTDDSVRSILDHLDECGQPVETYRIMASDPVGTVAGRRSLDHGAANLLCVDRNLGYGGGNNVGIAFALRHGAKGIWILNNDTRPYPSALEEVLAVTKSDPRIGLVGVTVVDDDRLGRVQARGGGRYRWLTSQSSLMERGSRVDDPDRGRSADPDFIYGCALFMTAEFVRDVGAFEEGFHLYCEEIDLAERAKRHGWRLAVARSGVVRHELGATLGSSFDRNARSLKSFFFASRAAMMLVRTYRPVALPFAAATRTAFAAYLCVQFRRDAAIAVLRGMREGFAARTVGSPTFNGLVQESNRGSER